MCEFIVLFFEICISEWWVWFFLSGRVVLLLVLLNPPLKNPAYSSAYSIPTHDYGWRWSWNEGDHSMMVIMERRWSWNGEKSGAIDQEQKLEWNWKTQKQKQCVKRNATSTESIKKKKKRSVVELDHRFYGMIMEWKRSWNESAHGMKVIIEWR